MKKIMLAIKCTNHKSTRNYLVRYHQHVLLQKDQNISFVRINAIASVIRTLFPNFVSEKLPDKGKVLQSGLQEEFPLLRDDTGVKKAGIFFLICHSCDNTKFQEYENPQSYNQQISQTILAQIAMKNTLQLISKRKIEYQLYKILEERDSAIAQEITQKEFCQGIFSRCAPSLYITSSWQITYMYQDRK